MPQNNGRTGGVVLAAEGRAALALAEHGYRLLPLAPGQKAPLGKLAPHGRKSATDDPDVITGWWSQEPRANIGVACEPSGIAALDVDERSGGHDALHELERTLGELPETVRALTGGAGQHILFAHPGVELRAELAPGVEIKSKHYIVVAPSLHPSGRPYAWDIAPGEIDLADVPAPWLAAMRRPERRPSATRESAHDGDVLKTIPAVEYVERLSGRTPDRRGFVRCPFHGGGEERTPSLKPDGTLWTCFGSCAPLPGRSRLGGDIYQFAALVASYELPLRGNDFKTIRAALGDLFSTPRRA